MGENKEVYIFLKIFISLLRKNDYQKIFIVFDESKETFRHNLNKDYKANREKSSDELIKHLKSIQNLINNSGLFFSSDKNFEADDLIASFIKKFKNEENFEFHIFSQDKDLFQLLSENVFILRYNKNKDLEKFGIKEFFKINNFSHENFKYYLALMGDKVDNIKGIPGIGEKRAKYIVENFQNIEKTFLNIDLVPKEIKVAIKGKEKEIEENLKMVSLEENIELKD
jgi:DNA polymerase-1